MKLLALETATEACSVALLVDGEIRERFEVAPRRHAELVLPWCEALLADAGIARAQLDAIAVGRGPGAFTGVRLAIAIAQGIALALDRPVLPVSTLAALAMQAPIGRVIGAIDARMGEIYIGHFEHTHDDIVALDPEHVADPRLVIVAPGSWHGVGTGFSAAGGALQVRGGSFLSIDAGALPHAADVGRLALRAWARGEAVAADRVEPAYLRDNVALTLAQQQAARDAR